MTRGIQAVAAAAALLSATLLAACQTGPAYRERGPGETIGYSSQQIAPNRYRVSFSGGTSTRREDVENFLLRRAAEVTLESGHQFFEFEDRETERETSYRTRFDSWDPYYSYYPYRPYYWRPYYWSNWAFTPAWERADVIPISRYTAYSEIVVLTAEQARNNPRAIPADDVLARLVPPEPEPPV